ncbi:C40 family peptidase [Novipirellula artificiosorum]|uniref:Uncharacterized protein n=1 Tax=Novipirellula artificiosorum TaxID=2528016 RepID=A0A5C6DX57_9BACT|nr:hypothetical protein [Novipirellula artificiosorum]TWU39399.1 hypothetical protein Poly41_22230 [Novipirellula artificiosorum]
MKLSTTMFTLLATACVLSFAGCKDAGTPATSAPGAAASNEDGTHVHDDGTEHAPHGAHGVGPHDGTIADWGGGKYHVEFTVDHDKQEGTVYILGADEKSPVPIEAESIDLSINDPVMQVSLKAAPQSSDPAGKASRFVGNHESLGVVQEYAGTIGGVVDGTPYSGDFTEEAHGDHEH